MKLKSRKLVTIIANGEKPAELALVKATAGSEVLIAADGGSRICYELGLKPQVIIGDLDSVSEDVREHFPEAEIIHKPDQEHSDMEKAVDYALSIKAERINILSALGFRTDHLLENILLFYYFRPSGQAAQVEINLYDNWGRLKFLEPGRHIFRNRQSRTVSFFSLGKVNRLTMKGFRYNLDRESFGEFFGGLSNVYEAEECYLEFAGARLIWYECYQTREK